MPRVIAVRSFHGYRSIFQSGIPKLRVLFLKPVINTLHIDKIFIGIIFYTIFPISLDSYDSSVTGWWAVFRKLLHGGREKCIHR